MGKLFPDRGFLSLVSKKATGPQSGKPISSSVQALLAAGKISSCCTCGTGEWLR
jgi:hypothetical protein